VNKRMEYALWKQCVEAIIIKKTGLDSEAIPDYDFQKAYQAGWSAMRTANAAISAAMRY
jgi:hypothetical protein